MDQQLELSHLRKADDDIANAQVLIQRQEQLLCRLEMDGHRAEVARSLLETMRETLRAMEEHRKLILEKLASMQSSGS